MCGFFTTHSIEVRGEKKRQIEGETETERQRERQRERETETETDREVLVSSGQWSAGVSGPSQEVVRVVSVVQSNLSLQLCC